MMTISIAELAAMITALTVILTALIKMYSLARKVEKKLDSYDRNLEQLNLHLNKMALLDKNMPIVDRIHAGEWYIAHGGNGIGKKVYNQLLQDIDIEQYQRKAWEEPTMHSVQKKDS